MRGEIHTLADFLGVKKRECPLNSSLSGCLEEDKNLRPLP